MTPHKEKVKMLKNTIEQLYVKEGRSKAYISRLLEVNRRILTAYINEWGFEQGNVKYLTPSNQKFLNKHKTFIKSKLDKDLPLTEISKELGVSARYLTNTIVPKDKVLSKALEDKTKRLKKSAYVRKEKLKEQSCYNYNIENLPNERWKEILGHESYYISDYGRVKSYVKIYDAYKLLTPLPNVNNGRMYVWIDSKGLQISRLVGFAFVDGWEKDKNTIEHIDNDVQNNHYTNLEWVSQKENNQRAYDKGRKPAIAYGRNGRFKKIKVDNKYEFKTIRAFAKFAGVSETTAHRYVTGDVAENPYEIKLIY